IGNGPLSLAIIGDSHAGALFTYADEYLRNKSISAMTLSGAFCAPLLNGFEAAENCKDATKAAFDQIIKNQNIRTIVLVAEWANYTKGFRDNDKPKSWKDSDGEAPSPSENVNVFRRSLAKTLELLERHNKKVVIVHPVPEFPQAANNFIGRQLLWNVPISFAISKLPSISVKMYHERNSEVFSVFNEFKDKAQFFEVEGIFCEDKVCLQSNGDLPLYSDTNHLNYLGAKLLFDDLFRGILGS
ncbi:MAG TPA: SGNH hydrolase domain-containing protein, partial [Gammaproteobacteria bacterium]